MALMKSGFKAENQDLIHGDFTEVNVTYWGVQREEKKEKENKNKKKKKMPFMEPWSYSASFFGKTADAMRIPSLSQYSPLCTPY